MFGILETVIIWAIGLVEKFGYAGIFITMALESAAIPIPSEVVVPLGGFGAAVGIMNLWLVAIVATAANLTGSLALYAFGFFGRRPVLERYGKYVLIHKDDIQKMDGWLSRHGMAAVFFSRLLPGVRTFSSLAFGAGKVKLWLFSALTFAGSFIWNLALAYAGFALGANWGVLRSYFEKFEVLIVVAAILATSWFIRKHIRRRRQQ